MNYAKLRGKIREVYGTQEAFAAALGMNTVSLSQRLTGKLEWKTSEIVTACHLLDIPIKENWDYFFKKQVEKTQ